MPAGLSGGGYLALTLETVKGTYLPPNTAGTIFVPILSSDLKYVENRYFSPQIRQSTEFSDVKQGKYHVEGTVEWEVDPNFLPYFMHCSRHTIAKSGAGPYTYIYTPSTAGASSTAASGNVARTMSLTEVKNGIGFGWGGCVMGGYSFMINDEGILIMRANIIGENQNTPGSLGTPAWAAPALFGADASSIYTDAAGTAPAFGSAAETGFDGYTFEANFNAQAENRIVSSRAASYISYHQTEITLDTNLDFIDRTEYDNFVATTQKAIRLESLIGGANFAAATSAVRVDINRFAYETYDIPLSGLADTVKAAVTGQGLGIASGTSFKITVKAPPSIA